MVDVVMSEEGDHPQASETQSVRQLRKALATLLDSDESPLHPSPTTYSLASAFLLNEVSPLRVYQAASHLREGQLREVVQFLMFSGPQASMLILRFLAIMQGLPGNWELTMEFLEQQTSESFKSLPTRGFSLVALLGGRKAYNLCDWSSIIERAFRRSEEEARWAISKLSEVLWTGPTEPVLRVIDWATELPYESEPSIWREIKWAAFARSICGISGLGDHTTRSETNTPGEQKATFEDLSSGYGRAAPHYVRFCGTLIRRRLTGRRSTASTAQVNSHFKNSSHEKALHVYPMVLTPSLRSAARDMASYLAYGVPFILEGPSGCGKTALLSFLARETSYEQSDRLRDTDAPGVTFIQMDSAMLHADGDSFSSLIGCVVPISDGGGFRWRPGPIGAAVERGDWIIFENIGRAAGRASSASAIIRKLATAKPGDRLKAPGRGDDIVVGHGFRCIATRTVTKDEAKDTWEPPGTWDTWHRITLSELSFDEKVEILSERHVKIEDCIPRIVTVVNDVAKFTRNLRGSYYRSPTLREAVRICHRLEDLKGNNGSISAENAFLETMDVIAAWCPTPVHSIKLSNIVALCWSLSPQVGADMFSKHKPNLTNADHNLKIGRASSAGAVSNLLHTFSRLSLTGHTLRFLERTLRCLEVGENVLLSGETGSGKTAVIQELASLMGKKLVVVNLSRQSELDDLIGGFRPVDVDAALPLLAKRFESTFCRCMSREKNANFLDALQKASRAPKYRDRALRLMEGALKAIPKSSRRRSPSLREEWDKVIVDLHKIRATHESENHREPPPTSRSLRSDTSEPNRKRPRVSPRSSDDDDSVQVNENEVPPGRKKSRQIDFEFTEGVLVQAMRNGYWVLLDELNLAPPELLERLVSILDAGQVELPSEKGEVVYRRHGFSLFGAMNPPTDAGKRPLPSVLRTRFTEFHVGDMTNREDLEDLVVHKFMVTPSTKEETRRISRVETEIARDAADFYLKSYEIATQGQIEDSAGKPVRFSLRSLSRMLQFAKGLQAFLSSEPDGKRRALFEGALTAFGTSLPKKSRAKVNDIAKRYLLRGAVGSRLEEAGLAYLAPSLRASGMSVRILHGFPVELNGTGCDDLLKAPSEFVATPGVEKTLKDVCRALVIGSPKLPVLLQGPTAAGKTSLIRYLAQQTGNKLIRINNHEHTELTEYFGGYVATEEGSLVFNEGPLVRAARNGEWIMLDELNLAPPDVLESLNRLLDDNREIFIPETGETIKAATGFRLFATQNPPGLYGGRKELSRAFRSRFVELYVDELADDDLQLILERRADIPASFARKMIAVLRALQIQRRSSGLFSGREGYITARDLFRWASRQPRSKEELGIHGFMLLAERARSTKERSLVRNIISKEVGISLDVLSDRTLYALDSEGDRNEASQECLDFSLQKLSLTRESLRRALSEQNIIPTPSMRRMLTLIIHCVANEEPALLVGATGGGKTSSCAAIAAAISRKLLTVNCHRHTEASDILGGFRPVRHQILGGPLFHWVDGPLVDAMKTGSWMLADEINMTDDAVIERFNSVLELERSLVLSEKGTDKLSNSPEVVVAREDFRILATMNPGGDFGKKELSPALRNRFTELWIPPPLCLDDYVPIIRQRLNFRQCSSEAWNTAFTLVYDTVEASLGNSASERNGKETNGQFIQISVRDLAAWCDFITAAPKVCDIDPLLAAVHGSRLVLLDGLSVGSTSRDCLKLESNVWQRQLTLVPEGVRETAENARYSEGVEIVFEGGASGNVNTRLKIDRFCIPCNSGDQNRQRDEKISAFSFDAPNTKRNSARIARAMCVGYRPVLLEGPPGSGKSSLVAALASASGFKYSRINLSEGTEMSDLVGCDAPGQDRGSFVFRRGPLLEAFVYGSWILLDELNLASQSVLEGLNSVLDHRKSLYVPELNKEFLAHPSFRIFGAQNSAADGGGRRGLPRSFLNRFTRVAVEAPDKEDIKMIILSLHPQLPPKLAENVFACLHDLRNSMKHSLSTRERFGLRDAIRWCDLLSGSGSPNHSLGPDAFPYAKLFAYFDAAILQSLRACEREAAEACYYRAFGRSCDSFRPPPSLRPRGEQGFRIGFGLIESVSDKATVTDSEGMMRLLESSRCSELQAISFAVNSSWPVTLFSPSSSTARVEGKRLVQQAAALFGRELKVLEGSCLTDSEEFIGGYVQNDAIASMRLMVTNHGGLLHELMNATFTEKEESGDFIETLVDTYQMHTELKSILEKVSQTSQSVADSLTIFLKSAKTLCRRIESYPMLPEMLGSSLQSVKDNQNDLAQALRSITSQDCGVFKWRKSQLMNAIERGEWIFLQDADACHPALLDRLNPIFERAAVSASEASFAGDSMTLSPMILAEAPSNDDGSPVCLRPHRNFRMFFSVSKPVEDVCQCGLSKALLDRSLKLCIEKSSSEHDDGAFASLIGLSPNHWTLWSDGGASRRRCSTSSSLPLTDGQTAASRARFICAANACTREDLNSRTKRKQTTDPQNHTRCANEGFRSPIDIPFTSIAEYVDNPVLSLMERDLASMRMLETAAGKGTLRLTHKVEGKLRPFTTLLQSDLQGIWNPEETSLGNEKQMLLWSSANAFLLGSMSRQDLISRARILKEKAAKFEQSKTSAIYIGRADAAIQSMSALKSSEAWHETSSFSRLPGFPLDPLFGLDQSSIHLSSCLGNEVGAHKYCAKRLRVDLLALHSLRETWTRAEKSMAEETFFSKARVASMLRTEALDDDNTAQSFLSIVAFDAVSFAVGCIDKYYQFIQMEDGWESSNEDEWISFFTQIDSLCELMTASKDPPPCSLAAYLLTIFQTLHRIEDRDSSCFEGQLGKLYQRLQSLSLRLRDLVLSSSKNAMPESKQGQALEMHIMNSIARGRRGKLSTTQIDAVINGLATMNMRGCDRNKDLLAELHKVVQLLNNDSSSSNVKTCVTDHWSRVIHHSDVRLIQDAMNAIWAQNSLGLPTPANWKEALRLLDDSVSSMKCLNLSNMISVAFLRKLGWLLEAAVAEKGMSSVKSPSGEISAIASLSLLVELNALFVQELAVEDEEAHDYHRPLGTLSTGFFLAQGTARISYWNLSLASAEAACSVAMVSQGKHRIKHTGASSKIFLQRCFQLCTSPDLAGEEFNGSKLFCSAKNTSLRDNAFIEREMQDKLDGAVRDAETDDQNLSDSHKILRFGMAWVAIGLKHTISHHGFIKRSNGIDPAQFSRSLVSFAFEKMLLSSASTSAYEVFAKHRLGGDPFLQSVPVKRYFRSDKDNADIIAEADTARVFRPAEKSDYPSYEAFVDKVHTAITRRVIDMDLFRDFDEMHSSSQLRRVEIEAAHVAKSCAALANDLKCAGMFGHFRDISTFLALGIQEVQYGLSLIQKASQMISIANLEKKKCSFVADLLAFPRAVHREAAKPSDSFNVCAKLSVDANCIIAVAEYIVGGELSARNTCTHEASAILSEIVSEWKKRLLVDERETEKKESLHVLREASCKQLIPNEDIANRLAMDSEEDFAETFNPISLKEEEELCGLRLSEDINSETVSRGAENGDLGEDLGRRISPRSFWHLHKKVYPPLREAQNTSPRVADRVREISSLSSQLFTLTTDIIPAIGENSSVWETFTTQLASEKYSTSLTSEDASFSNSSDQSPYNFYIDSNVEELIKASTALLSLSHGISRVQETAFKETGNHPVLDEVNVAIQRIAKVCTASTPLSRIIIGIENVLRKADEWQRLFATSATRMDAHVLEVAKIVARWRKLEVKSWPLLLQSRVEKCKERGSGWIFLLFDGVLNHGIPSVNADPKQMKDVISVVDQFLRSSAHGDFGTRLDMVTSLGSHILALDGDKSEHSERLGRGLMGLSEYYGLFLDGVTSEMLQAKRAVDKELSEFTQLVSWNASTDLGSSCKMFKEKDKYLQYYRLKAAGEKTRRKLHKLCLKVDAIVREPIQASLTGQLSRVGFFCSIGEEGVAEKKNFGETDFSHKISVASQMLTRDLISAEIKANAINGGVINSENGSFLSRVHALEAKLNRIGNEITSSSGTKCELAEALCVKLRSAMRDRIKQLRAAKALNVQVKKRALVELFKVLRKVGISPFEQALDLQPHEWVSTPDPSPCAEYNAVANELFWTSSAQIQRLQHVSDSRFRNCDLGNGDASKVRAFCKCLFKRSCAQREALNELFRDVQDAASEVNSLNEFQLDPDPQSQLDRISALPKNLPEVFSKLRKALIDVMASKEIFHRTVTQVRKVGPKFKKSTSQAEFLIELHSKQSVEVLCTLDKILSSAASSIEQTITDERLITFSAKNLSHPFASFDKAYVNACFEAKRQLSELAKVLEEKCSKARSLSHESFPALVLTPVLSLVRDALEPLAADESKSAESSGPDFEQVWSQLRQNAEAMIESILIGSQRLIAWNDLHVTPDGLQNNNGNDSGKQHTLNNLVQARPMNTANERVLSLKSAINMDKILSLLRRNANTLRSLPNCNFEREQLVSISALQKVLIRFAGMYINKIVNPCLEKVSRFHAHSLSLLRSLSMLFVGLCIEGFCRPPEHEDSFDGSCEQDGRQGGGFGEAGDGDMSTAQNVSDQIEDEEQLLGLRDDLQNNKEEPKRQEEEDEDQDGVDMTTDFDGDLQNLTEEEEQAEEGLDEKEMAPESGVGDNVVDQRIWGDSDEVEPNSEGRDEDHAPDNTGARREKSELVARNEEVGEATDDNPNTKGYDEKQALEDESEEDDAENGSAEDKRGDTPQNNDEEKMEGPKSRQKENPFDNEMDTDSDDGQRDENEEIRDHHSDSDELPSKNADSISFQGDESRGNEFQDEKGLDESNELPDTPQADNYETESHKSDASHPDEEQAEAMLGVEQPNDGDEVAEQGRPTMDSSNVPEQLSLDEESDIESGRSDEEASHLENMNEESNQTELNKADDYDTDLQDGSELHPEEDPTMRTINSSLEQQLKSLPAPNETKALLHDRENGVGGDTTSREKNEVASTNVQGKQEDEADRPSLSEHDERSTVDGSVTKGFRSASNLHEGHDKTREKMGPDPLDVDRHNHSKMNPNPLRISRPEELVQIWERHLQLIESEQENQNEASPLNQHSGTHGLWEYQDRVEGGEKDMHALGNATDEQHRPLTGNEMEEQSFPEPEDQMMHNDEANGNENDVLSSQVLRNEEEHSMLRRREEQEHGSLDVEEKHEEQTSIKLHPAHKAVERVSERTVPPVDNRSGSLNLPQQESFEPMEIDIKDEELEEHAAPSKNNKLLWQMESLSKTKAIELWHQLDEKISPGASALCEQLRLVLEPTTVSALSGGYRTGKRLNMRKVIEYVASDFQKDRIWLRRVKPDKRSYDVLIAIDDSASMAESEAGAMALESLALVLSAMSTLEIGRVGVARFGAEAEMVREFDESLSLSAESGGELLQKFSFSQRQTDVVKLLSFIHTKIGCSFNQEVDHISLALVISDGRLSNRDEVRRQLRNLKSSNVLIAFVILDQIIGDQPSIYEVKQVDYDKDGSLVITPYMEDFPVDFYTTVQDVQDLPSVLGDALRQWVEAANV